MVAAVKGVVALARRVAQRRGQEPSTAHLLLAMVHAGGAAARLLASHGVREVEILAALRVLEGESAAALDRVIERARELSTDDGAAPIGVGQPLDELHLLIAVLRDARSAAYRCLEAAGATPERVRDEAAERLGLNKRARARRSRVGLPIGAPPRTSRPTDSSSTPSSPAPQASAHGAPRPEARSPRRPGSPTRPASGEAVRQGAPPQSPRAPVGAATARPPAWSTTSAAMTRALLDADRSNKRRSQAAAPAPRSLSLDPERFPLLTSLGRDLRADAHTGRIDPVIGRDAEIEQLLDVLARRRSNNPILIGPPGVGKTAIVEGLALRLARGGAGVHGLEERTLIELSAGALIAGTGVRGALSDRIRQLKAEVARGEGQIVLFIDEIHAILGGGDGPDELSHELKAALARGELPCIGATTEEEYRKYFERDAALARRFCPVHVEEPSAEDALRILDGVAPYYAAHHEVDIDPAALEASVELSVRFLTEQQLPDKAIGVLDQAAARSRRRGIDLVDRDAVAAVIAERARVPLERLLLSDGECLSGLESLLAERIVGQRDPLARIADALRKSAAGLTRGGPLASFLLLGPTGVGKTETARAIHEVFFPGTPMTHLDMSELSESHAVARLLGAPPGYLGHDQGGQLTESVRRRPYQLVLLDELDKAHPQVWMSLLPLLEEGHLTDGRGRRVDFKNTIVVMTSNLGVEAKSSAPIGFGKTESAQDDDRLLERARRTLPPELWNRIDEPLVFAPLTAAEVGAIALRHLERTSARMHSEHGVTLEVDESAVDTLIAAGGYDPELGARPMRRIIGRLVESPLAAALVAGRYRRGQRIRVAGRDGVLSFVPAGAPA